MFSVLRFSAITFIMSAVFRIHVTENGLPLVYFAGQYCICQDTVILFILLLFGIFDILWKCIVDFIGYFHLCVMNIFCYRFHAPIYAH
jgi:hypothetical protein